MSEKNTGGPALPVNELHERTGDIVANHLGVSVRDYFAAKAMQGFCANPAVFAPNGMRGWGLVNCDEDQLTHYAYFIADAALRMRAE